MVILTAIVSLIVGVLENSMSDDNKIFWLAAGVLMVPLCLATRQLRQIPDTSLWVQIVTWTLLAVSAASLATAMLASGGTLRWALLVGISTAAFSVLIYYGTHRWWSSLALVGALCLGVGSIGSGLVEITNGNHTGGTTQAMTGVLSIGLGAVVFTGWLWGAALIGVAIPAVCLASGIALLIERQWLLGVSVLTLGMTMVAAAGALAVGKFWVLSTLAWNAGFTVASVSALGVLSGVSAFAGSLAFGVGIMLAASLFRRGKYEDAVMAVVIGSASSSVISGVLQAVSGDYLLGAGNFLFGALLAQYIATRAWTGNIGRRLRELNARLSQA